MKFKELNPLAQTIAIGDYLKGWLETHESDTITPEEIYEILSENDDNYTQFGTFIN
jgi:hypothetical protein